MKTLRKLQAMVVSGTLALAAAPSGMAADYLVTPTTVPQWTGTDTANLSAAQIAALVGYVGTLSEVYVQIVGGSEGGSFAGSYTTTFDNTSGDPMDARIDYDGNPDPTITGSPIYLYVKDGNQDPAFYVFNISDWNRTDDIYIQGFWPQQGAISHVAIFTGTGTPPSQVPDGGATLAFLGMALVGVESLRRRMAARK
jgi:hypothetical protein